jgi:4-hydroxy-tetrahydrodipicolinate synthase
MSCAIVPRGIIAYPITPFTPAGVVDLGRYKTLLERLLDAGVHAVAPLGSTGVLPYLGDAEREAVAEATMEQVQGRMPVVIGVSAMTTERTVHHARIAEKLGAAAVMIIPMSYWKLTEAEVYAHFETVAGEISLPVMAYNNPATGGADMTPRFLAKLLKIPNVTMIKESTGDVNRLHRLAQECGDDVALYNGSNPLAYDALMAGARGWCTAAPNLIARWNLELFAAVERGEAAAALRLFRRQLPVLQLITEGGLPRTIAAGLKIMGIDPGALRAPLLQLGGEDAERLREALEPLLYGDLPGEARELT